MTTNNNYSRNKVVYYEKFIKNLLCNNEANINNSLITDIAFNISEIANDKALVNKYIEKKLNFLIKNTIQQSIHEIKIIPDYEKNNFSRIGLKLPSQTEKEVIQTILGEEIKSSSFYEICLNTRNFCAHFCTL